MKYLRFRPLLLLAAVTLFLLGCDPLAPEPTPIVIVLTATPTPVPTAVPSATPTITPTPTPEPTATPTFSIPTPWVCNETKGRVLDLTFESKVARQTMPYRIYLPPCYTQTGKRYPYVILMHGSDRDEKEWTDLLKAHEAMDAGLALGALPPMILVMPGHGKALPSTGNTLANMNSFVKGQSWESLILDELMPAIERSFCTWNDREGRAIGGISRGGFWAFSIAFRNPTLFSAIGGHSPFFDPDHAPPAYNPLDLAKAVQFPPGAQPRIWLDLGKNDYARPNVEIFQKTLVGRGIDPGYTLNPVGEHDIEYWGAHTSEYLSFYGQIWPRDIRDLPSCTQ